MESREKLHLEKKPKRLVELIDRIRTFTEEMNTKGSELDGFGSALNKSSKIVFLGFAYHKLKSVLPKILNYSDGS